MKHPLTLLMLAIAGMAQSQPLNRSAPYPDSLLTLARQAPSPLSSGSLETTGQLVDHTDTYPYELEQNDYLPDSTAEDHIYDQGIQTTGISSTSGFHMQLYPNPATSEVNITSRGCIRQVDIYNASGAIVTSITINGRMTARIDVNSLPSGIYFLQAMLIEGVAQVLRFIKR